MTELKKCPFCGGNAEWGTVLKTWIVCRNCGFETPYSRDTEETIKLWNNRTAEQEIRAKAIDEITKRFKDWMLENDGLSEKDIQEINNVAKQMKGGAE